MARRRRELETAGLSFLDCICCGFGAVILLLVITKIQQPAAIPGTACVTTEGLGNQDRAHFDSAGQRELGVRFAAALANLGKAAE